MALNIGLLESSFELLKPQAKTLVTRFYDRLFEKYPAVRPMFARTPMAEQQKKLLALLVLVMQNLRHPDKLGPALKQLGARHVAYGTQPEHYGAVAETLLSVMADMAGTAWTADVKQAWTDALNTIAHIMLEGAREAAPRPALIQGGTIMAKGKTVKGKKKGAGKGLTLERMCKNALDNGSTNVLMCDRNFVITYANTTSLKRLRALEQEIAKAIPGFSADALVGSKIDMYHKVPERQRQILNNPANLPHRAEIRIGPLMLDLLVSAILSDSGEYVGNVVEWEDVTEKKAMERERTILTAALENAGTNIMIADASEEKVVFVNKASAATLQKVEGELKSYLPGFDLNKVVGGSIHRYHKNPEAVKTILHGLTPGTSRKGNITPGNLVFKHETRAIYDEKGHKLAYMVEWRDATAEMKAQREVERLINAAAAGQLSERINADESEGFFKTLSQGINKMLEAVVTPLHEAQTVLSALAAGDLTKQMIGTYQGEFEQMKTSLNSAMQTLSIAISTVRDAAETVTAGAEQITKGNEDLSQRTSEQAGSLEETSASMEEMTSTVKQNADNAKQANQLAIAARDIADKGGSVTTKAVEAMAEINKSSKKIADIITVIDEIAFQTNLLALNAAVEAARAGEHGRGFAVVAAEVRNLAQRSATAAKEIKGLINESIQRVTDGSELVNQSGKTLEEIVGSVKRVTDIIAEISAASQEQASGIDQVNKAIMQMDTATQQNAALVEETTSASQCMKDQARELMRQVEVFRVNQSEGHHGPRRDQAAAARPAPKPSGNGHKPLLKKSFSSTKPANENKPAGIAAGNGIDRRRKEDDFEEF